MTPGKPDNNSSTNYNFEGFFENNLCGFILADKLGFIKKTNLKVSAFTGIAAEHLINKKFSDLLTIGGKIYYETHLSPLLRIQGFFEEIVLEIKSGDGKKLRVLVNALESKISDGNEVYIQYSILKATDRLYYEMNLQESKKLAEKELLKQKELVTLREQLIGVLGHDLRNPLMAIKMASALINTGTEQDNELLIGTIKRSTIRMSELIKNIMDFARTRLGEGLVLQKVTADIVPVIEQVISEEKLIYPKKEIIAYIDIAQEIECDPPRLSQLLSNLISNAISHGEANSPVKIFASILADTLKIEVTNTGKPIPAYLHEQLFTPFTRESDTKNQNGLGLGLFICAEIAKAHNATLSFTSTEQETRFIFKLPIENNNPV